MTTDSQKAADSARNQRDKEAGIVKRTLRYKEKHNPTMQRLAKQSREGKFRENTND